MTQRPSKERLEDIRKYMFNFDDSRVNDLIIEIDALDEQLAVANEKILSDAMRPWEPREVAESIAKERDRWRSRHSRLRKVFNELSEWNGYGESVGADMINEICKALAEDDRAQVEQL